MAEGFHDFASAEVLTAANTDDYLMRQTIMRFASAAARDSALSSVLVEGLFAYLKDVDQVTMYDGSSWVQAFAMAAGTTWTPTVAQAMVSNVTKTVTYASYQKVGRWVTGSYYLSITGAGGGGSPITVSLPFTAAIGSTLHTVGTGFVYDATAAIYYNGPLALASATTVGVFASNTAAAGAGFVGAAGMTAALANGDFISGTFCIEMTT